MEGFLGLKIRPALRRIITRLLAITPALAVALSVGENGLNQLLILSQVILSCTLPFAIIPLVYFTSSRSLMSFRQPMGNGSVGTKDDQFVNGWILTIVSWFIVVVITGLNIYLVISFLIFG